MASFADRHREWKQLERVAEVTGSRDARQMAEQARLGLKHHPAANGARGFHDARCKAKT